MIKLNPRERLTIPQILAHHWLKETNEDDSEEEEEQSTPINGVAGGGVDDVAIKDSNTNQ